MIVACLNLLYRSKIKIHTSSHSFPLSVIFMRMNNQELEWGVILLELNLFILKFVTQQYNFFSTIHFGVRWSKNMSVPSFLGLGDFDLEVLRYVNLELLSPRLN